MRMPETAAEFDQPYHGQEMSPQDVARAIVGPHMSVVNLSLRREPGKEAKLGSEGSPSHEHQVFEVAVRRYFRISPAVLNSFEPSLGTDLADAAKAGHAVLGTQQREKGSEHKAFGKRASGPASDQIPLSFALPSLSQDPSSMPDNPGSGGKPRRIRMGASAGIGGAGSERGSGGGEGQGGVAVLDDVGRVLLGDVGMQSVCLSSLYAHVLACPRACNCRLLITAGDWSPDLWAHVDETLSSTASFARSTPGTSPEKDGLGGQEGGWSERLGRSLVRQSVRACSCARRTFGCLDVPSRAGRF